MKYIIILFLIISCVDPYESLKPNNNRRNMKQINIELLNSIVEMYYMETGKSLESITIDEYSFNILKNNLYNVIGKPKQLELYTSTGQLIIKCSQIDLIKKTKKEIELLQQQLKELEEFQNK